MKRIKEMIANGKKYTFLLEQLVTKSIKLRYRKSYLGILWSLIEPLMTMAVLSFIFSTLLGRGDKYFPIYILSGRLLYSFFSNGTKSIMNSIRLNAAMIKKVYVPKYMYPLASGISSYIIFLISLIDLFLMILVMRMELTPYLLLSIVPVTILFFLTLGVGLILTSINVFFRDVQYIWDVASMLIMYTCGIFYKVDSFVGTKTYIVFQLNPLYALIKSFRDCIYGVPMELNWILYALVFSLASCVIGMWLFKKHQDSFIFHI